MKLYWSPRSPFVRKVMVCAHELGIAGDIEKIYTLVSASTVNNHAMQANPIGRIPALVTDEGKILYDSVVICEYLDALHGNHRLFPRQGDDRWNVLRRHALANGTLEILVLWRGELSRPTAQRSPETLDAYRAKVTSGLAAAARDDALESADIDIAHVTLGVVLGYLDFRYAEFDWRTQQPALAKWYESFGARPSMRETAPQDELQKS
jgi:glutathione S-transferase